MKKISLITCGTLPVPAVKGGAVETLLELLVKENEIQKQMDLQILCVFDQKAKEAGSAFIHTKFVYIRSDNILEKTVSFFVRLINKLYKILFKNDFYAYSAYYRRCYQQVIPYNPDYIVFEGGPNPLAFLIFKKRYSVSQLFLHLHGVFYPTKKISEIFGAIIGVSNFVNKVYLSTNKNKELKINVIYNCINETFFSKRITQPEQIIVRNKMGFEPEDFIVLFCGRICPEKGVYELLSAIMECPSHIKLLIIGSPEYALKKQSKYSKKISKLVDKSKNKIVFTGYMENTTLFRFYQSADCMAVPSIWEEPAGLVLIEGMLSGLPMIVTNSGGITEYVNPDCAIIIEKNENLISNLSTQFIKLSENPIMREKMAIAAYSRAQSFSVKTFYDKYTSCFK